MYVLISIVESELQTDIITNSSLKNQVQFSNEPYHIFLVPLMAETRGEPVQWTHYMI